ncbi:MAG: ABC transporter permease, partial [Bacteroidales bacterium]|nr:ABC transporter permease [Bacteroidales bacterium]
MIKNYFITALRYLLRNRSFSIINTIGLSLGISAFILLFLYVRNELTYDSFHSNGNNIYRLCENQMEFTKSLAVPQLLQDYPEVINGSRYLDWSGHMITFNEKELIQEVRYVDTGFFSMFNFPLVYGNAGNPIAEKNYVVISKKIAEIYFGDENPVGKSLDVDFGKHSLVISGVINEIPGNSSIKFDLAVNHETGLELSPWLNYVHDWYNTFSQSYIMLKPGTDIIQFEEKIQKMVQDHFLSGNDKKPRLILLPLKQLHDKTSDNKTFIYILIFIAIGILIIASINFINLSTANSIKRSAEVGIRKAMGAGKKSLLRQFLGESLIISFLALFLAIVITELLLPVFNRMFNTGLFLDYSNFFLTYPVLLSLWLLTGLLSGIIPSVLLSRFNIISSLKGEIATGRRAARLRSAMVIFQLLISIVLIIGTTLMKKQIHFMKNHDLKIDHENVIVINTNSGQYKDRNAAIRKLEVILKELENDMRIVSTAPSQIVPGRYDENYNNFYPEEWSDVEFLSLRHGGVHKDYFKTYGIEFIEGDPYDENFVWDSNAVVINKAALMMFETESAVDKIIHSSQRSGYPHKIAAVVDDFHYMGLHRKIQPVLHYVSDERDLEYARFISVRVKPGEMPGVLDMLRKKYLSIEPAKELDYFFTDEEINKDYKQFEKISSVVGYFTILSIVIACLGLIALTVFVSRQRTKEIGIRKANGARTSQIMLLLTKEFTRWVVVAFVIACPVAWYFMDKWLQNFA